MIFVTVVTRVTVVTCVTVTNITCVTVYIYIAKFFPLSFSHIINIRSYIIVWGNPQYIATSYSYSSDDE